MTIEALRQAHEDRIKIDYEGMKPWLPQNALDILDIGCGHPLIDIPLARHYGESVTIHLMDGDERIRPTGKEQVGFQLKTTPWKSRHLALEVLYRELPGWRVQGYPADPNLTIPCDLIISRRAWGHHFPVRTYAALADRSVRGGGRIILDIRIGSDTTRALEKYGFRVLSRDLEKRSVKCQRLVLTR